MTTTATPTPAVHPTHSHYYVSLEGRGCGIRVGTCEDDIWNQMAREVGTNAVQEIREATEADIAYVRGMGGRVPSLPKT